MIFLGLKFWPKVIVLGLRDFFGSRKETQGFFWVSKKELRDFFGYAKKVVISLGRQILKL